ncbi:MAG: holo-ACP synthase [Clostridia bacterium]|nr:holo-ACP synthase [Clostridia bacterium]
MVGIDIVDIKRIAEGNVDGKIENRILSDKEKEYISKKSRNLVKGRIFSEFDNSLAGFWAAKEAVLKAFGIGLHSINLKDIQILHKQSGEPYVELMPAAVAKIGGKKPKNIEISISHDAGMAVSVCFLN